jgi:DNA-directed RNA polymerase subunit K/omega
MGSLTLYEMALVVGSRAEQLASGDASLLPPDVLRRVDPGRLDYVVQAEEELRHRKLDFLVLFRQPRPGADCTAVALVPLSNLDMDIVPRISREMVLARTSESAPMNVEGGAWVNPYSGHALPYGGDAVEGTDDVVIERPFRVSPCDFSCDDCYISMALICTRMRTYSGVVIEHEVSPSEAPQGAVRGHGTHRYVVMYVRAVQHAGLGRLARMHVDGSIETWVRLKCVVFGLWSGRVLCCHVVDVCNGSQSSNVIQGPLLAWHRRNRVFASDCFAFGRVELNGTDLPDITVFFSYDPSLHHVTRGARMQVRIQDIVSSERGATRADDNPHTTETTIITSVEFGDV